jgi:hypothetical protein
VMGNILGASDASRSFLLQCHATGTDDLVLIRPCPYSLCVSIVQRVRRLLCWRI